MCLGTDKIQIKCVSVIFILRFDISNIECCYKAIHDIWACMQVFYTC